MAENNTITFSKEKDKLGGFSEETLDKISQPIKDNSGKFNNVLNQSKISNKPQDKKTQKTNNKQNNVVDETPALPSDINEVTAKIVDDREKALKIKNEVINKGGDKEVLKSELVKAFPDKDDLATVAKYFQAPDENSDTEFSLSDDEIREMIDSVGKTAIEEKTKKILQGVGGGEEVKPTGPTTTPTTTPETETEPTEEKEKDGWSGLSINGISTQEDIDNAYNLARKELSKEKKSAQEFYSRIFSVPEWFPKGLDEFREAKKKYTNRPVYNKDTGKYEMGEGASPIAAKKELNIAKQVVDGLTKDVKNTEKSLEENTKRLDELSESKRQTSGNWEDLPDDIKETYRDKANKFISDNRQRLNQEATQLINSAYSKGGDKGKELVKKYKEKYGYEPEDTSVNITSPKELADLDKIIYNLSDSERDEFERLYSGLQDSLKRQWDLLTDYGDNDNLAKEYFEKDRGELEKSGLTDDTYDPTQNKTVFNVQKETVDKLGETLDAIKNGDLKDANEKVDELKSAYEQSKEQQKIDMQEYSAAKRKLIKENAGNIARNVWFIIDLVTTMNRNAARLMPQGKYSPNLGNFETPALFQDYAAQLQGMRETYNKANEKALMNDIDLETLRGKGAVDAQSELYKLLPQRYKNYIDNEAWIKRAWTDAEIKKALMTAQQELNIDFEDKVAKNDFLRKIQWSGDVWNKMSPEEQKNYYMLNVALAENKDKIALGAIKYLFAGTDKDKWGTVLENIGKSGLNSIKSDEDKIRWLNDIEIIQGCIDCVDKAALTANDIGELFQGAINPVKWLGGKKITNPDKAREIAEKLKRRTTTTTTTTDKGKTTVTETFDIGE